MTPRDGDTVRGGGGGGGGGGSDPMLDDASEIDASEIGASFACWAEWVDAV